MSSGNLLFMFILFLGPVVSVSSSNWVICWVGLELSFLGAMPLLMSDSSFMSISKESIIKYFCIQALGSGLLMLGGVVLFMDFNIYLICEFIFTMSLMVKLGVFPAHFWVPSITMGLSWFPMFILLGWQKIAPFAFLINICENSFIVGEAVVVLGGVSAIVGAFIGLNQTSFRAMLGGSSIAHTGWSCVGSVYGGLWTYFFIYCFSFIMLVFFLLINEKMMISLVILSMSGLPPFLMFVGKWVVLKSSLLTMTSYMLLVLPILSALFSLFFYLKFFYSFYLSSVSENNKLKFGWSSCLLFFSVLGVLFSFLF